MEWIGTAVIFVVMVFWIGGGFEKVFAYFATRQAMKHKERLAQIEASKKKE